MVEVVIRCSEHYFHDIIEVDLSRYALDAVDRVNTFAHINRLLGAALASLSHLEKERILKIIKEHDNQGG